MTPLPGLRFVLLQGPEKNNNANKNVIVILSRCHRNRFLGGKDRVIGKGHRDRYVGSLFVMNQ